MPAAPHDSCCSQTGILCSSRAVEITPIKSVDKIPVGNGKRGPITEGIQRAFFDIINGEAPDRHGWLTYVYPGEPLQARCCSAAIT